MSQTKLRCPSPRSGGSQSVSKVRLCVSARMNFIKLQQKVKLDKKLSLFARVGIPCPRSRSQSGVKGQFRGPSGAFVTYCSISCFSLNSIRRF